MARISVQTFFDVDFVGMRTMNYALHNQTVFFVWIAEGLKTVDFFIYYYLYYYY